MNTKIEIWLTLAREKYPSITEAKAQALCLEAAAVWYSGEESELTEIFDQYVMLKSLKGL
jgi:hypothetical protein